MSATVWITIAGLAVSTAAIKAFGPVVFGGRELPRALARVIPMLAPALLTALVVTETVSGPGRSIVIDARSGGLVVAAVAIAARAPLIVVVDQRGGGDGAPARTGVTRWAPAGATTPGRSISIRAPPRGPAPARTVPWWASAIARTIASPSPAPPARRLREASVR